MSDDIIAIECRHVVHIPGKYGKTPDLHYVKEQIHYKDGTIKPNSRLLKDFKRPFYVTNKMNRNFKQKKEAMEISKLMRFESTQTDLRRECAKALGKGWSKESLRNLGESPYLYGTTLDSEAIIKKKYKDKYPDISTKATICAFDTETEVINEEHTIVIGSMVTMTEALVVIKSSHLDKIDNVLDKLEKAKHKFLKDKIDLDNFNLIIKIVEKEVEVVIECFKYAHDIKPDFVIGWNMDFDIQRCIDACYREGIRPADVFSDPNIPRQYRYFKYKRGMESKLSDSGVFTPLQFYQQWHTVIAPASFYILCSACTYYQLRLGRQGPPKGRGLDAALEHHIGENKLKFSEADDYFGLAWHNFMRTKYPVEYVIYNIWDSYSLLCLDNKLGDISTNIGMHSENSPYRIFNSMPKKIMNNAYYHWLKYDQILGSIGPKPEGGENTLSIDNWIITLPARNILSTGIKVILEDPNHITNVKAHVCDLDCISSYPSDLIALRVSKATTMRELIDIVGVLELTFRNNNINLTGGHVNAAQYANEMFGMPSYEELLEEYDKESCETV